NRECLKCDDNCKTKQCNERTGICSECEHGFYPNPENPIECIPCDERGANHLEGRRETAPFMPNRVKKTLIVIKITCILVDKMARNVLY
ncbi:MAG: hypothetical protein IKL25_03980, partial [Clostridia bacterium]|nr:hypothetical protein [Clostridia bacterium]